MPKRGKDKVFDTDQRIRLGVWGLGRGMHFYNACRKLHFDVVAGCDFNAHMREEFSRVNPGALVTGDAEVFLDSDIDAVLLATYCHTHAEDALRCLAAGKHVLSEVTAFHTMAEGVRLVEAAEASGRVYNLAENYGFTAAHMYLARKWREGVFGELMYAEGEYVHEVRSLAYTHIDGVPIEPGDVLHAWRSWLHFHYYNTHSLGPVMFITGLRPVRVTALPCDKVLAGYPPARGSGLGAVAPSLIRLSNGAVFRNLMAGSTNDTHAFRYWGDRGSAEVDDGLTLRLGGAGISPKLRIQPDWGELTPLAETMGHGGGDFFVLYYFARQILFGEAAPFDLHNAADVTIPGILAYRSALENGQPFDVPDFRKKADRDRWRNDETAQPRYDTAKGCFPRRAKKAHTAHFNRIMSDLLRYVPVYRAFADWHRILDDLEDPGEVLGFLDRFRADYPALRKHLQEARFLAGSYPRSDGAKMLREMLELADAEILLAPGFSEELTRTRKRLKRRLSRKTAAR